MREPAIGSDALRIAFRPMGSGWTGGAVFLRNLLESLRCARSEGLSLHLLRGEGDRELSDAVDGLISHEDPPGWKDLTPLRRLALRESTPDTALERRLGRHGIDLLFGPVLLHRLSRVRTLSWIADFQHARLPDMFVREERDFRDGAFRISARLATRVVLLGESVRRDFAAFAPECADKARVLSPVAHLPSSAFVPDPESVAERYRLPGHFIFLPNQFWKHKDHRTAFEAVRILRERGRDVVVVCSGAGEDYRHPGHFRSLFDWVAGNGLSGHIRHLGVLPRDHAIALMRRSVAMVNPSLFEGWGMAVAEGAALGKRMIVSDIPAHREQGARGAAYFRPGDAEGLAESLLSVWEEGSPGPDREAEARALREHSAERRAYGRRFLEIAGEAMAGGAAA